MKKFIFAAAAALCIVANPVFASEDCPPEISDEILDVVFEDEIPTEIPEQENADKVCFCHNIEHNPVTICTAQPALINAHMKHVNGENPSVLDTLEECPEEAPVIDCDEDELPLDSPCFPDEDEEPSDDGDEPTDGDEPADDGDEPADDGDEPADDGDEPAEDGDDASDGTEIPGEDNSFEFADQVVDGVGSPVGTPFDPLLFEGSGCQLNPAVGTQSAGVWLAMAFLPAFFAMRRNRR